MKTGSIYSNGYNPYAYGASQVPLLDKVKIPVSLDSDFIQNIDLKTADATAKEKYDNLLIELGGYLDRGAVNTAGEKITTSSKGDNKVLEYRKKTKIGKRTFDKVRVFTYKEDGDKKTLLSIGHYYYIDGKMRTAAFTWNGTTIDKPSTVINYTGHEALGEGEEGSNPHGSETTPAPENPPSPPPGTEQPSGEGGGAQPSGAQPSGAQPSGAQPSGAQPSGAQPSGAQPSGERTGETGETGGSRETGATGQPQGEPDFRDIVNLSIDSSKEYKGGDIMQITVTTKDGKSIPSNGLTIKIKFGADDDVDNREFLITKNGQIINVKVPNPNEDKECQLIAQSGDKKMLIADNLKIKTKAAGGSQESEAARGTTQPADDPRNIVIMEKIIIVDKDGVEIEKPKFKPGDTVRVKVILKNDLPKHVNSVNVRVKVGDGENPNYTYGSIPPSAGVISTYKLKNPRRETVIEGVKIPDDIGDGSATVDAEANFPSTPTTDYEYGKRVRSMRSPIDEEGFEGDNSAVTSIEIKASLGKTTKPQLDMGDYNVETGSWSPKAKDFTMPDLGASGMSRYGGFWTTSGFDKDKGEKYPEKGFYYHQNPLFELGNMRKEYCCNDVLHHALNDVLPKQAGFNGLTVDKSTCCELEPMKTEQAGNNTTQQNGWWEVICTDSDGKKYKARIHADTKTVSGLGTPKARLIMEIARITDDKNKPLEEKDIEKSFNSLEDARKKVAEVPPKEEKKEEKKEK